MTVLTGAAGHTTLTAASWDQVRRDPELEAVDLTLHILGGRIPQHVVRAELSPTVWLAVPASPPSSAPSSAGARSRWPAETRPDHHHQGAHHGIHRIITAGNATDPTAPDWDQMADWAESQAPLTDDSSPTLTGEPARQAQCGGRPRHRRRPVL
ncbi:hypothetical protein [Cutibacterium avidum]|uniref:hypothetical protein n=1 Tax=Cutibacterium avidum TaxID=33010 RepID=UPI002093C8A8|nr:hypothetical protein [Cutibacterium avidum]